MSRVFVEGNEGGKKGRKEKENSERRYMYW